MNFKVALLFLLVAMHSTFGLNNNNNLAEKNELQKEKIVSLPVDCDSYFNDVIQIEEEMMNDFTDLELRNAYKMRNKSMTLCLDFFTKFLAKLDYYLDNIEGLESEEELSSDESSIALDTRSNPKSKKFWKRSINKKNFW